MIHILLFQVFQIIRLHQIQQLPHRQKHGRSQVLYIPEVFGNGLQLNNPYHLFLIYLHPLQQLLIHLHLIQNQFRLKLQALD